MLLITELYTILETPPPVIPLCPKQAHRPVMDYEAVVEELWPELAHKLPPKKPRD